MKQNRRGWLKFSVLLIGVWGVAWSVWAQQMRTDSAGVSVQDAKSLQMQNLISEGDCLVQEERYEQALSSYRKVLSIDPYSEQAQQRIKNTLRLMGKVATLRQQERKAEAMGEIEREWSVQAPNKLSPESRIMVRDALSSNAANIFTKLQTIRIPVCHFNDADLAEVLNYLQEQSREQDSERQGVNIVFKAEPEGVQAGTATGPAMRRAVTLNLRNVPLIKVLDFIQSLSSYQYKVEEHAVYVFPNTETSEVLLIKTFPVPPHFFAALMETEQSGTNVLGAKMVRLISRDVKEVLAGKGVKFPTGASAAYLPNTAKLVVRNTPDQLNLIDQLLAREQNVVTQIEISTKFLEFSENKLKDLSFNYRVQGMPNLPPAFATLPNGTVLAPGSGGAGQTATQAAGRQALNFTNFYPRPAVIPGDVAAGTALRNSNNLVGNPLDSLLGIGVNRTPNMISVTAILDGMGAQMLITALESNLGADLMSEPKVTLFNGQRSKIRAVREFRYPTQWSAPKVPRSHSGNGGNTDVTTAVTVVPSNPTNFQVHDVGVTLEVRANATPDRRIDLQLKPEVTDFQGFINYGGNVTTLGGDDGDQMMTVVQGVALTPVFSTRSVETQMQVFDGQTVVMGGFIRSDNQAIEDKVPVLGDIPLMGQLFRSKSSQVVKRNLMIFLTARMIRTDGRYVSEMEEGNSRPLRALPVR